MHVPQVWIPQLFMLLSGETLSRFSNICTVYVSKTNVKVCLDGVNVMITQDIYSQ